MELAKSFLQNQVKHEIDRNTIIDIGPTHPREIQEQIRSITLCDHLSPHEKINEFHVKVYQLLDYEVADLDFEVIELVQIILTELC